MKSNVVGQIARKHFQEVKDLNKAEIFALCEELLSSGYMEEAFVVSDWCPRMKKQFVRTDMETFERWIDSHLDNWAKVDTFCNHTVGDLLQLYPDLVPRLFEWARSPNRWMRRASAVSLIVPAKRGLFLDEAFRIAGILMTDKDDLVQKGFGWLLKEESRTHEEEIFEFVLKNRQRMGRTALRYAIEKMPMDRRREAMSKPI